MNNRERFQAAMRFKPTDRPAHLEYGFWKETYLRWKGEGLPESVIYSDDIFHHQPENDLFNYFGVTKFGYVRLEQYYLPAFTREVVNETSDYTEIRDERGVRLRIKKGNVSIPQFLEYPIKTMADYHKYRERLLGLSEKRYPPYYEEEAKFLRNQGDIIVGIHIDGFFGYPRELMGVERLLTTCYDDPDLIHLIIQDRVDADIALYEKVIADIQPDFAFIWEDMCYKNGPLISPATFRRFMLPAYQKFTAFLRKMGVDIIVVDSDGDIRKLIPLWLEGGVTCLLPFEVKAGLDVCQIRHDYPSLQIIGGINKHRLEGDKTAIDNELSRVLPTMLSQGGYAVALDHWVHESIPFENFCHYVDKIKSYSEYTKR